MKATDTVKILLSFVACSLLVVVAWSITAIREDFKSTRISDAADAERSRQVLKEFFEISDNYDYQRLEWINRQPNSSMIARGSPEWRVLAKAYRLTKPALEMIGKLKALRTEYQDLTWKHPNWSFMVQYTPDVKSLILED